MYKHKYLEELNIHEKDYNSAIPGADLNNPLFKPESRAYYKQQRQEYGFDALEVYDLDKTAALWLYEHIRLYMDLDIVNFDRAKVQIPVLYENEERENATAPFFTSRKETHTQREAMLLCLDYLKKAESEPAPVLKTEEDIKRHEYAMGAFRIFAEILPLMWE
jgi:hypothetical protein